MVHRSGLIVLSEMLCGGCGRVMKYAERYGYIYCEEEGDGPVRLCADCCRQRGYLSLKKDDKGREKETFL